jgi:hypothetical protein
MIIAPALPYKVELIELKRDDTGYLEDDDYYQSYLPLAHAITCFGYAYHSSGSLYLIRKG